MLESRAQEIKQLDSKVAKYRQDIDALNVKFSAFYGQDPHALDSLKKEHEALKGRHASSGDRIQTLQKNLAGWEMERRRFKEVMIADARAKEKTHKEYILKQEESIARLRGGRDNAVSNLGVERQKCALVFSEIGEMRQLANSRKDEIKALKGNVERLKIGIAAWTGYKELLACYGEKVGEGDSVDPFLVLRDRVKASNEALKAANGVIEGLDGEKREKAEVYCNFWINASRSCKSRPC